VSGIGFNPIPFVDGPGSLATSSPTDRPPVARRSLYAFAAVAAGFLLARHAPHLASTIYLGVSAGVLAASLLLRGRACKAGLIIGVILLSAGWFTLRTLERPADSLDNILDHAPLAEASLLTVTGVITDHPSPVQPSHGALARFSHTNPAIGFAVSLDTVESGDSRTTESHPISGTLWVRVDATPETLPNTLAPGQRIRISGRTEPIRPAANPGELDRRLWVAQEGRVGNMSVPSIDLIEPIAPASLGQRTRCGFWSALGCIRRSAAEVRHRSAQRPSRGGDDPRRARHLRPRPQHGLPFLRGRLR
jgi:hypothetical protein